MGCPSPRVTAASSSPQGGSGRPRPGVNRGSARLHGPRVGFAVSEGGAQVPLTCPRRATRSRLGPSLFPPPVSATAFYKAQPVIEFVCEVLDFKSIEEQQKPLTDSQRVKFTKEIKGGCGPGPGGGGGSALPRCLWARSEGDHQRPSLLAVLRVRRPCRGRPGSGCHLAAPHRRAPSARGSWSSDLGPATRLGRGHLCSLRLLLKIAQEAPDAGVAEGPRLSPRPPFWPGGGILWRARARPPTLRRCSVAGLKVEITHCGQMKRKYRVCNVTRRPASNQT